MSLYAYFEQKLNRPDLGLLVLRVTFGGIIFVFGVQKLLGGEQMLTGIGGAMAKFGITFAPLFWGLLAALTEMLGGLCIFLGIFFRPAALLLFFNMIVATVFLWGTGPTFSSYGDFAGFVGKIDSPLTFCLAFLALLFTGPGKYAIHKGGGGRNGAKSAKE